jgi:CO/xanthine dehydrogenase FAD-binding subunit
MRAFSYVRARDVDDAVAALRNADARLLAGGTNLLDR